MPVWRLKSKSIPEFKNEDQERVFQAKPGSVEYFYLLKAEKIGNIEAGMLHESPLHQYKRPGLAWCLWRCRFNTDHIIEQINRIAAMG